MGKTGPIRTTSYLQRVFQERKKKQCFDRSPELHKYKRILCNLYKQNTFQFFPETMLSCNQYNLHYRRYYQYMLLGIKTKGANLSRGIDSRKYEVDNAVCLCILNAFFVMQIRYGFSRKPFLVEINTICILENITNTCYSA